MGGQNTRFWLNLYCDEKPLGDIFRGFYTLSPHMNALIVELCETLQTFIAGIWALQEVLMTGKWRM